MVVETRLLKDDIMNDLMKMMRTLTLILSVLLAASTARAQTPSDDGWNVGIYPVFGWLPLGIDINVDVPPFDDGAGGGAGDIVDSRFDGAFLVGFYASKGLFRVDGDGMWAAVGGDRPARPNLTVDADVIYFHVTGGVKIAPDLYAIGGLRRLALKYDIGIADFPNFERKPGFWDPVVGIGWHREGARWLEVHATFEGGGFGAGTDVEWAGMFRLDFKPARHFGITGGYNLLYFKGEDTVGNRTFQVEQTLHGPLVGIGLYF
jgi:hypothetical protein